MSEPESASPSARHWRDIPQEITPRAMSRVGRRRLTLRNVRNLGLVALGALLLYGGFQFWQTMQNDPTKLTAAGGGQPVEHIVVETDGVLTSEWVEQVLDIKPTLGLMELDLWALRSRLEAHRQVKKADLRRKFPNTLLVHLEERSPVVRLRARMEGSGMTDFLVGRDGVIFEGHGYDRTSTGELPWLAGVRLRATTRGYEPLDGMDRVADLLSTARGNVPELYRTWHVISLGEMARDGQIVVQSSEVPRIIFGLREDFYTQVARLDLILEQVRGRPEPLKSIDLSVGAEQVPVAIQLPPQRSDKSGAPTVRFRLPNR
ncbi:cell division protein FtsQ/DivIB [Actomonas aquatica]|uniref:FtsQ-type POTRA domain-containing protein n=1 Tax=Actomonas aquatica TaxID=2866162 RepID=A0ABZ1CBN7_9BACT|nr:FtsQ-type POTRA domain-containing protein [Opitutus sp. WL0086]WRQ89099.1 FtsQ-type POTRA domain-containing protein [Opitutus sp. WL0086]